MFTLQGLYKWVDKLPRLVFEYNLRKHRTIDIPLTDVNPVIAEKLLDTVYNHVKIARLAKFKVSNLVRVSKTAFEKGYTPYWITKVFKIVKVQRVYLVTYFLKDYCGKNVFGAFYEFELHRATHPDVYLIEKILLKEGNKVYVKWLGFNGSDNSWINKKDFI
ncbi:uncharacterized protein LOC105194184 [Solenopsis invicta]|uniref:uncharacterized protein LOC105194184 n=1 Tax=Solenopsis invicta TaxID=13686 RepID=UPI0005962D06|nr:uncharacterized protein LOC105194184 [Solenopsis invicta]